MKYCGLRERGARTLLTVMKMNGKARFYQLKKILKYHQEIPFRILEITKIRICKKK